MTGTVNSALEFLIKTLFDIYLTILVIRIILIFTRINYFDPVTQFIVKLTDFIIKPLRRIIPNFRYIELSSLLLLFVLEIIKFSLLALIAFGAINIVGLFLLSIGDMLNTFIQVFFYAILMQAILSWVQPQSFFNRLLYQFTTPIMRPFQRIVPLVGGVDISPIPALITLQLLNILLVNPLMSAGYGVFV